MQELITIDGSYGEGGGQIIRTSLSLSAITGQPVEVVNVRARRTKPGLQPQHLTSVKAAASLCGAWTEGAEVGSTRFRFEPHSQVNAGNYRFDIGTAGATALVAQTALVPLALQDGSSKVAIIGGTHVPHAPVADYLAHVALPAFAMGGLSASVKYEKAGFFPKGGGQIVLEISPSHVLNPITMVERGKLRKLTAYIVACSLPEHVAARGAETVRAFMKAVGRDVEIEVVDLPSLDPGAAVVLVAECEGGLAGFTSLGERGKPMERVATQPCKEFMEWWKTGAPCDEHMADQLVLPMAFSYGESRWVTPTVTDHLRTVLWVTEQFVPIRYSLEERPDGTGLVTLQGVGRQAISSE
jgi:RNA 3'-terminal phosphate cyclase (ATP)